MPDIIPPQSKIVASRPATPTSHSEVRAAANSQYIHKGSFPLSHQKASNSTRSELSGSPLTLLNSTFSYPTKDQITWSLKTYQRLIVSGDTAECIKKVGDLQIVAIAATAEGIEDARRRQLAKTALAAVLQKAKPKLDKILLAAVPTDKTLWQERLAPHQAIIVDLEDLHKRSHDLTIQSLRSELVRVLPKADALLELCSSLTVDRLGPKVANSLPSLDSITLKIVSRNACAPIAILCLLDELKFPTTTNTAGKHAIVMAANSACRPNRLYGTFPHRLSAGMSAATEGSHTLQEHAFKSSDELYNFVKNNSPCIVKLGRGLFNQHYDVVSTKSVFEGPSSAIVTKTGYYFSPETFKRMTAQWPYKLRVWTLKAK